MGRARRLAKDHNRNVREKKIAIQHEEKIPVTMCTDYWKRHGGCHNNQCPRLHLCRFFVTHVCKPKNGVSCPFSHDHKDEHNKRVLKDTGNEDLNIYSLRQAYKNQTFNFKKSTILPEVCKFYNGVNEGCKHSNEAHSLCERLHMCRHFILNNCKYDNRCRYCHELSDPQPRAALARFGVNVDMEDEASLLGQLRQVLTDSETTATSLIVHPTKPRPRACPVELPNDDFIQQVQGGPPMYHDQDDRINAGGGMDDRMNNMITNELRRLRPPPIPIESPLRSSRNYDRQTDDRSNHTLLPLPPINPPGIFNPSLCRPPNHRLSDLSQDISAEADLLLARVFGSVGAMSSMNQRNNNLSSLPPLGWRGESPSQRPGEFRGYGESPSRRYEESPPRRYGESSPQRYRESPPRRYEESTPRRYRESPPRRYAESPPRRYAESHALYARSRDSNMNYVNSMSREMTSRDRSALRPRSHDTGRRDDSFLDHNDSDYRNVSLRHDADRYTEWNREIDRDYDRRGQTDPDMLRNIGGPPLRGDDRPVHRGGPPLRGNDRPVHHERSRERSRNYRR